MPTPSPAAPKTAADATPAATPAPATAPTPPAPRFLVLVPQGDEWHVVTKAGRLVTTTERTQVPLGRIEGKRAPLILADNLGAGQAQLPFVDLTALLLDQVAPA